MKPKFMKYATNKEQLVHWELIYKNLSGRQKVKWRKEMHRAIKEKIIKNPSSEQTNKHNDEHITISI